jgi:hypothetical protein
MLNFNKIILTLTLCLIGFSGVFAQKNYTISGYIEDLATGEKLIGANVFAPKESAGTSTNTFGFFSLTLPKDSVYLTVSYVGYQTKTFKLYLDRNIDLNFALSEGEELETLEIVAEDLIKIEDEVQMSQMDIPIEQIKKLPSFLGEVDILKVLQLLPGVQSGNEGTSGIYVRGGSPDQNLILLDGVPVYNVSHLFGFFSVFNADAIKSVTLTKGGYPARFGGRLSSVLEINMKEGNLKEYHGEGSIGLISSKFTFEGPIEKDVSSFIVSARRTYLDVLARPFIAAYNAGNETGEQVVPGYYFYDFNAKVNRKFGDRDRVYWSFYGGNDDFYSTIKYNSNNRDISYEDKAGLQWGNVTSSARWNHQFSNKLFSNFMATYTRYKFDIGFSEQTTFNDRDSVSLFAAKYLSSIEDWGAKADFDYVINPKHYLRFGTNVTHHTFTPGATQLQTENPGENPIDTLINTQRTESLEFATYIEDEMRFGKLKMNVGLHYSSFLVNNKFYHSLQPRIGLNYKLPGDVAMKASYATMTQYIHLLTSGSLGLPTDLWVPTTENVVPEQSWQAALGFAKTFGAFEVSLEGYYKNMDNLVAYKEGASFLGDDILDGGASSTWEDKVVQGNGTSYGAELFLQKKKGNTTGWIGYTLSWTDRQFEGINSGNRFPFRYDRRHDISVVGVHKFNEKISISAAWVYGTGNAVTIPTSKHEALQPSNGLGGLGGYYGTTVTRAESVNGERMRAYHRLDFSIEFFKKKKRYERTFVIGTYNTYNRANPFFIQLWEDYDDVTGEVTSSIRQFSLFPLIPSVAWKFKF